VRPLDRLQQAVQGLLLRAFLPLALRRQPLPSLLASLDGPGLPGAPQRTEAPHGDAARRLAEQLFRPLRFWPTTCLYRALGSYALLRAAGQEVRFVIGVRRVHGALEAHAWLERDGRAIVGVPGPGDDYTTAYAWPADPAMLARHDEDPVTGLRRSDDAVLTELKDGTGVLLHLRTRFYFTLNPTGVQVWKALAAGVSDAAGLTAALASSFPDADPSRVRADVDALLTDLTRESLVTMVD
jgi:hypothetical protein